MLSQTVTAVTSSGVGTTGRTADMINGDGQCTLLMTTGTMAGTGASCAITVQESTDGTTWTAITGTIYGATTLSGFTLTSTGASTMTNATTGFGFQRQKRYLQTIQTTSGTSGSWPVSAVVIEQKKTL